MLDYSFYSDVYGGDAIPAEAWPALASTADAQMCRYERIYTVNYETATARSMAVCAIADAMYAYAQLDAGNGAVQSVSIGSVSESRVAASAPDTSPAARATEYYRCAQLYATIYRGC